LVERPIPFPTRWSLRWWGEYALIFTVFGITGSSALYFVRPLLGSVFGIEGTMREGPWSYRILSIAFMMPIYSLLLVSFGTLFGRHVYFKRIALRMWQRFIPKRYREKSALVESRGPSQV